MKEEKKSSLLFFFSLSLSPFTLFSPSTFLMIFC